MATTIMGIITMATIMAMGIITTTTMAMAIAAVCAMVTCTGPTITGNATGIGTGGATVTIIDE